MNSLTCLKLFVQICCSGWFLSTVIRLALVNRMKWLSLPSIISQCSYPEWLVGATRHPPFSLKTYPWKSRVFPWFYQPLKRCRLLLCSSSFGSSFKIPSEPPHFSIQCLLFLWVFTSSFKHSLQSFHLIVPSIQIGHLSFLYSPFLLCLCPFLITLCLHFTHS